MVDQLPALRPIRQAVIIDDDPDFAEVLKRMLTNLGLEVTISTDARSSYTFDIGDDDIVFLDVLMPNTSGLQVLERFDKQDAKCAVVLMSGSLEHLNAAEIYAKTLDIDLIGSLEKPFRLADIKVLLAAAE